MKRISAIALAFVLLCGCVPISTTQLNSPQRVVALMGSIAEIWHLAGGSLVGVTEDAKNERNLFLDENVKIIGTVKSPNIEEIVALKPDLVLTSSDLDAHKRASSQLESAGISCKSYHIETFDDYLSVLHEMCTLTGRNDLYEVNGSSILKQINHCKCAVPKGTPPTVLLIRAMGNRMKTLPPDHMTSIMLSDLGADNIATRHPSLLDDLSMEEIIRADPDFILVVPMGDVVAALATIQNGIANNPAWSSLTAVRNKHYSILPKDLFHYKPNARWGESYEYLFKILYPNA